MTAESTTTVRARRGDSERLKRLAKSQQTSVVEVLHRAVDALERQELLQGLNEDYGRLQATPALWDAYLAERQEWDQLA
ncbi:MAG: hypothetical protein ACRDY2_03025 [Acidimicrobiales bacterium]